MLKQIKHCWAWFHKLRNQYGILTATMYFIYNSKHYKIDGSYKENPHDRK